MLTLLVKGELTKTVRYEQLDHMTNNIYPPHVCVGGTDATGSRKKVSVQHSSWLHSHVCINFWISRLFLYELAKKPKRNGKIKAQTHKICKTMKEVHLQ